MDDRPAEVANASECCGQVGNVEVRQGGGVARTGSPSVEPEPQRAALGLPSRSGRGGAYRELDAEDAVPEPAGAIGIVGREFDQWRGHGCEYGQRRTRTVVRRGTVSAARATQLPSGRSSWARVSSPIIPECRAKQIVVPSSSVVLGLLWRNERLTEPDVEPLVDLVLAGSRAARA